MSNAGLEHKGKFSQNGLLVPFLCQTSIFPKNSKNILRSTINAEMYTAKILIEIDKKSQEGELSSFPC